ncbi:DUF4126 domain-containing protein [Candidatus Albibeggiatoa sp. nov. NOAA]|uniref:DUF4126 domain-containing protein n=1 Tax=Candidatus Albibeggiatoa sp. nov. NOAA TaxID=3162724 RepID=UPI003304336A|nr:DUF4126 domain-containing protein [Thiotrichaceae bacterium]
METTEILNTVALTLGTGWASGLNIYAAVLMLGVLEVTGQVTLPETLAIVSHPLVLGSAALMYGVEFFADKIPGFDSVWDSIHTFIRIPLGALLAAGAVGDLGIAAEMAGLILGGALATGSHATKAGGRVLLNTSPEPVTNWTASVTEDAAVFGGLWAALYHPWVFIGLLAVFILLMVWLLPKIWSGIKTVFAALARLFGSKPADNAS